MCSTTAHTKPSAEPDPVRELFDHWCLAWGKRSITVLDKPRRRVIERALKMPYPIEQLKAAITAHAADPWCQGQNPRKQRYDGIHLALGNAHQIEKYSAPPVDVQSDLPERNRVSTNHTPTPLRLIGGGML